MALKISIIVLTWNGSKFLDACLSALIVQDYQPREIIVVDNDSKDESVAIAEKYASALKIIQNDYNLGYSAGNNVGIRAANGDVIILLNQDTVVQPGWLSALVDTFKDSKIGIAGCKILYPDNRGIQHAGAFVRAGDGMAIHFGWGEQDHGQYDVLTEHDFVTGAAFAIHRRVLDVLGGLEEQFYPAFYEEVDYCYRARRAGFRVVYQPKAILLHYETASLPTESLERSLAYHRNRIRFVLRHWTWDELDHWKIIELQSIQITIVVTDLVARARGYWDNLMALPLMLARRREDQLLGGALTRGQGLALLENLQSLRAQTHQRIRQIVGGEGQSLTLPAGSSPNLEKTDSDTLTRLMAELRNQSLLTEPQLNSKILLVGRFIDSFRRFWIRLVFRHYFVPILNQQSQVNDALTKAISELVSMVDKLQKQNQSLWQIEQILAADQIAVARLVQELVSESTAQANVHEILAEWKSRWLK